MATEVIVVATPEPTSMTDAYATIKVLAAQQSREKLNLVVNQVARPGDGRTICQQLQQVVDRFVVSPSGVVPKLQFLGDIPFDPCVREAVRKRQLLLELHPGSGAALGVNQVAVRLLGRA
jgi:flagellar biosynthesis protein FlhG